MDIVAQHSTKFNGNLKIDPEFRDKIPPLTEEEYRQLEENILKDGRIREPIVIWNGTIIDGHNRWRVVQSHPKIPYEILEKHFSDKWEAFEWMYRNQLGRRNLTDEQRTLLVGKMYEARKKSVGGDRKSSHQKEDLISGRTKDAIAKELGIGGTTVERAERFAKGVDAIKEESPEAADKVLQGKSGLTKAQVSEVPKMEPEKRREVVAAILSGQKPEAMKSKEPRQKNQGYDKETRAINDAMSKYSSVSRETESVAEYSVDDLYEEIVVNAKAYVDMLRNTLAIRHSVLDKDRDRIRKGVQDIIDAIVKVRNLI